MRPSRIAPALLSIMSAFQLALAAGAPWGQAAYGGSQEGALPRRLRVTSGIAAPAYLALAVALASGRTPQRTRRVLLRGCVATGTVGIALNAASPSPPERIWSVWSLALAVSTWRDLRRPSSSVLG